MIKICKNCARGWLRENGAICCGAGVDDDGLAGNSDGVNPIWAERKYNPARIIAILSNNSDLAAEPLGSDCENMDPIDGSDCKMWEAQITEDQQERK